MKGPDCGFPGCGHDPVTETGMCDLHRKVTVASSASYLDDRHREGGHG